jgi:hypothetical protein
MEITFSYLSIGSLRRALLYPADPPNLFPLMATTLLLLLPVTGLGIDKRGSCR